MNRSAGASGEHSKVFLAAKDAMKESETLEQLLDAVARVLLKHVCDGVSVDMIEEDGSIESHIVRHSNLKMEQRLAAYRIASPLSLTASYGYPRVIKTGKPQLIRGVTPRIAGKLFPDSEELFLDGSAVRSFMCIPLVVKGRTLGALTVTQSERTRAFTADNLLVMERICEQLAKHLYEHLEQRPKK